MICGIVSFFLTMLYRLHEAFMRISSNELKLASADLKLVALVCFHLNCSFLSLLSVPAESGI